MDDRRKENRKFLTYFSQVTDLDSGYMLGYLVDLTTGGALMVGNVFLEPNLALRLRLDLPEGFASQDQIDLNVRVVWCRPDTDSEFYRTGLELVNIRPGDLLLLEKLLNLHGSPL